MMGNAGLRFHMSVDRLRKEFPVRELFEISDVNGYVLFSGLEGNDDVLTMILSHLSPTQLLKCRLVCKNWCNLIDTEVWRAKLHKLPEINNHKVRNLAWHFLFIILERDILGRNFIQNPYGLDKLKHWKILSNGGNHWKSETPPMGSDEPSPHPACFVTSFHSCSKEQVIDLAKKGVDNTFMDNVQPDIVVSEWYAGRFDCRAIYEMEVNLIKETGDVVDEFHVRKNCGSHHGSHWQQITHTFQNYGEGVRYIRFYHGGVDEQFWAGHYGSKMTAASVQLIIPDVS